MKYGSICSGVEAATLAWSSLGWKAVFFAEVEPFPSAVLCYRFKATRPLRPLDPAMADNEKERKTRELWKRQIAGLPEGGTIPNYGDFTLIKKEDVNEDIDLLVGGTPCQDLSIALRGWMIYYRCVNAPSRVMCSVLSHAWWIYAEYVSRKNGCSIAHAAKRWIDRCPASSLNPKGGQKTWYAETTNDKGEMVREYLLTTPVPKRSLHDVATQILYGVQTPFKAK